MPIKKVNDTIKQYSMIESGDKVIVALSGGADSVCLLHVLNSLKENFGFYLEAVHINHCIRESESDGDEEFCKMLCERLNIPIKIYRVDIPALTKKSGKSLEETARDVRYEKFAEISEKNGKIATAHTLSDNAETVMLNITRGTGLKGICGIPAIRENIIRPLIKITREQVEEYLTQINQNYKTDSTNLSDDYTRNKIRHKIIPVLKQVNNGFFKSFSNMLNVLQEENDFLEKLATDAYNSHFENNTLIALSDIPDTLRKRVISKYLSVNKLPISFDKINAINTISVTGGKINICKNIFILCQNDVISIETKSDKAEMIKKPMQLGENRIFENKKLIAKKNNIGKNLMDLDKINGKIIVHNRKNGDKIKLAGRNFTSSVKKLLNENIPSSKRPFIHFLSDEQGLIFMEGFGVAERVKVDELSKNILSINIEHEENHNG